MTTDIILKTCASRDIAIIEQWGHSRHQQRSSNKIRGKQTNINDWKTHTCTSHFPGGCCFYVPVVTGCRTFRDSSIRGCGHRKNEGDKFEQRKQKEKEIKHRKQANLFILFPIYPLVAVILCAKDYCPYRESATTSTFAVAPAGPSCNERISTNIIVLENMEDF